MVKTKKNNRSREWWRDKIYQTVIVILLFMTGFVYVYEPTNLSEDFSTNIILEDEKYFKLVYLGSSGCGFSNNEATHQMIKTMKKFFRSFAQTQEYRFLSTGIAMDKSTDQGIDFLSKSGSYDEIITGMSWFNSGAMQYIWETLPGYADTPQVLLILTEYNITPAGRQIGNIKREEVLLKRIVGMDQIEDFLVSTKNLTMEEVVNYLGLKDKI